MLGSLLWFTIAGKRLDDDEGESASVQVTRPQMAAWFEELGLDMNYLPAAARAVDAFRAASSDVGVRYDLPAEGQRAELVVQEVTNSSEVVVRHVLREVIDARSQAVRQDKVAELKFYRASRTNRGRRPGTESWKYVILRGLPDLDAGHVQALINRFGERYLQHLEYVSTKALRKTIREYVVDMQAILIIPTGGVYFVHEDRAEEVAGLKELVKRIDEGSSFHTVPLPDTPAQREMLTTAFEDEVTKYTRRLQAKINDLPDWHNPNAMIPPATYRECSREYQYILDRAEHHTSRLGLREERAAEAVAAVREQLVEMSQRLARRAR